MAYMNVDYMSYNLTGMLGDYGLIKSGSYGKLMKKYYAENSNTDTNNTTSTDKTQSAKMLSVKTNADDLKTSAEALATQGSKSVFASGDSDKISKAVNGFVTDYNNMVKSMNNTTDKQISRYSSIMEFGAKCYSKSLSKVGITVKADNTLVVDADALKKANVNDLKSLFSGSSSFAGDVAQKAAQISSAAVSATCPSTYQQNGMYNTNSQYNYFNWYL